jgi:hypothetical protein
MKIEFFKSLLCGLILSMAVETIFFVRRMWSRALREQVKGEGKSREKYFL